MNESGETVHRQFDFGFSSKIYGITSTNNEIHSNPKFIVINAGREAAICIANIHNDLKIIKKLSLNDWISSAHVYESIESDKVSFCMVSGHSIATEVKVDIHSKCKIINRSACEDKCTLYCSYITGNRWADTTIFGGNAFGELIIWTVGENESTREILHRLSGHNVN